MFKIEATGNTKEQAINALDLVRLGIPRETNIVFEEMTVYGNSEIGYKVVQYYNID